ncbi:MAG TPA: cytochrome c3 family protein [Blastocatellia bacterium]|nr:cytochrome c3 family protein [Blastocatellia bacterium]
MKTLTKALLLLIIVFLAGGFLLLRALAKPEAPLQPIDFNHQQHVTKPEGPQLECAFCHEHADKSPHATIPNVSLCMACHQVEKADSPEVVKLTAISDRAEQPLWVRVYWFDKSADVFFSHKPHIRAGVDCAECHGRVGEMTRVRREVDHTMGWCLDCHRQREVSVDCYVCHR